MTTTSGLRESVQMLYDVRREIARLKEQEQTLRDAILAEFPEDDVFAFEGGPPPLRRKLRSTGRNWDSHAVETCHDKRPEEFRRLMELGAVGFADSVIKEAIKRGNLLATPAGWTQGETVALEFDRK